MASSSGSEKRWNHDVFLSFRGPDTRNTFTGHLHHELKSKGINVFIDDKLNRGEVIASQLLKIIEESRISIVVLSENYASSSFCLDELTKILECRRSKGQEVIPVFYHVDPTDVKKQKGSFGQEFAKLEDLFVSDSNSQPMKRQRINNEEVTSNMETVQKWRSALTEVARLSGFHLKDGNHESTTIQSITKMVVKQIDSISSNVTEHHVGLASHIDDIVEKLSFDSNDVRVLGLHGMGGIGKTTLANVLYSKCARHFGFESSCFLLNVRENSNRYGLAKMQEDLLYQILGDRMDFTGNVMKGRELIKHRVSSKKVFVVIDDVDCTDQLENLAGKLEWFGVRSRIIITTRDLHLLKYHECTIVHKVIGLPNDEAMRLLSWHAFKKDQPSEVYKDISSDVVEYTRGHPLALKVLGSFLKGRSVLAWENELKKLKRCPNDDIIKVLKISYDSLDSEEKVIFLDIALFFKGRFRGEIEKYMDACGFGAHIVIERLIEKSLVYVQKFRELPERLDMHDLLEEMATQIAPRETSRLCIRKREEIPNMFSRVKNPESVEAILFFLDEKEEEAFFFYEKEEEAFFFDEKEEEALNLLQFTNLRILLIENECFTKMPSLPDNIRCLEWEKCSLQSIPFEFLPAELAFLGMRYSIITQIQKSLDENGKAKKLMNLTHLDFRDCEYLREIMVDFSAIPNIEEIYLSGCRKLKKIDVTIGNLKRLRILYLKGCGSLTSLPNLPNIEEIYLSGCRKLKKIDVTIGNLKRLRILNLEGCGSLTSLPNLPTTITHLYLRHSGIKEIPFWNRNLIKLDASNCQNLWSNIDTSLLGNCPNLPNLPEVASSMVSSNPTPTTAAAIDLSLNCFISLPINTFKFIQIEQLNLAYCNCLVEIPQLPHTLRQLKAYNCKSLVRFSQFQFEDFKGDFCNCHKITENEKQSWREMIENVSMKKKEEIPSKKYSVVFSENEIPEWFSYSFNSEGMRTPFHVGFPAANPSVIGIPEWFSYSFNSKRMCTPFHVGFPASNPSVIGIAWCAIFGGGIPIEFSVNEFTCRSFSNWHGYLDSDHMWLGFFTGFEWTKLLDGEEIRCTFDSLDGEKVELKGVGVHFIYEN